MKKKMTKKEMFTVVRAIVDSHPEVSDELKGAVDAFIVHEIDLLNKKSNAKSVDTKKLAEQRATMGAIVATLDGADEPMRATAIAEEVGVSVQKASALLRKLVLDGSVERETEKKVTTFRLP